MWGCAQHLSAVCMALMLGFVGCERRDGEGHAIAETKSRLRSLCLMIIVLEKDSPTEPPLSPSELVDWFAANYGEPGPEGRYLDYQKKIIRDAWRNPIVLLAEDGKLVALASRGVNQKWEHGKGDDITVTLDEVRE